MSSDPIASRIPRIPLAVHRWCGRALVVTGLVIALVGVATFHPPTCTGGGPGSPSACTSWEDSQWLMIGGVFLAVTAMLYLAALLREERRPAEPARGSSVVRPGSP
ncbi:MAG: hypothetical protein KGJ23_04965 [Euryarchaeota archaeon]|nr:hypothetical protein [Euryarchaeota archaeon]MDE1835949.1 hypothetical protein [Euryarchaeota archaeon]MDE1880621.1 hypothetical protein [Euryarchaeota archaeon]MDE2044373.1 hypothetical protein [Thermoplasmata archaeon]